MDTMQARARVRRGGAAVAVAFLATSAVAACQSSSTKTNASTTVVGVVTDSTGAVLTGVKVTAGTSTTTTASDGTYSLGVSPLSSIVVDFSKAGLLESSKPVVVGAEGTSAHVNAALMPAAVAQPLDATQGGTITGDQGASLTAGPGVFVDGQGQPVSGSVQVALTPLDPSKRGELAAYPGSLVGTGNGAPSLLQTYGVLDISATQNGAPLQLATGQSVTITIPVTTTGTLPATQDLWAYNLGTGAWDHEGTATLAGSAYTAQISHFSYHNIDAAIVSGQATCLTGRVLDASGKPVPGANVSPTQGASVDTLITTDSDGHYCTGVMAGATETITADATDAPYGEGSIMVTGGTPVPFPGSYTCANLTCQAAPDITLNQPPCMADGDCPADDQCCMVSGHGMCLESFACSEAQTHGAGVPTFDGSVPGFDASIPGVCTSPNGSVTATLQGETFTFTCFIATVSGSEGAQELVLVGSSSNGDVSLEIAIATFDNFAGIGAGSMLSFASDGGAEDVQVTLGVVEDGGVLTASATSGSLTVNAWSTAQGGTVSITIPDGTPLDGQLVSTSTGMSTPVTGTFGGNLTASVL